MGIENLGKKSEVIDANISNRVQGIEERIWGVEDYIESIVTTVKKCKMWKVCKIKDPANPGYNETSYLKFIGVEDNDDLHLIGTGNTFNKITEGNCPNLKREMPMNIQEAYRSSNILEQYRKYSWQN